MGLGIEPTEWPSRAVTPTSVLIWGTPGRARSVLASRIDAFSWTGSVTVVTSRAAALCSSERRTPDVVLIDATVPRASQKVGDLRALYPFAHILVYGCGGTAVVADSIARGADGYVRWEPNNSTSTAARPAMAAHILLTTQQYSMLRRLAEGDSDHEIARQLGIRTAAVTSCLRRVYAKLGATDRAHAVAIGFRLGLLD